jgi:hypothetical protein
MSTLWYVAVFHSTTGTFDSNLRTAIELNCAITRATNTTTSTIGYSLTAYEEQDPPRKEQQVN